MKTNQRKSNWRQNVGRAFIQRDAKMKCASAAVVLATLMLGLLAVAMRTALAQGPGDPPLRGDAAANTEHVRASQVLGMTVWNEAGRKIASVDDLVIDTSNGRLGYVILAYRDDFELGDQQRFPVPWQAFTCQAPEEGATHRLLLNASLETIRGAEGLAPGEWPDFDDREFTRQLHAHYGVRPRRDERRGGVKVRVGPDGVDVDVDP